MKALIVCHPKNLNDDVTGHWLYNLIRQLKKKYFSGGDFKYHTVDILDIYNKTLNSVHTNHFIADVWSDAFIETHKGEYNLVFMPDAGGAWYTDVLSKPDFQANMVKILDKTMMLVADNGILMLSKFYELHGNYIKTVYKNATIHHFDEYHIDYFIFTNIKPITAAADGKLLDDSDIKQFIIDLKNMGYTMEQISEMIDESQIHLLFDDKLLIC